MKRAIYFLATIILYVGCKPGDLHTFETVFYFSEFGRIIDITSNGLESQSYDILIRRSRSEFLKNPPDNVRLMVVDEETTAVEDVDFQLSTKNVIFIKGEWIVSPR